MSVSIIIPVYNAEKYLEQCIQSLILINEKKVEFIFVNDGSTDSSKQILEHYEKVDGRIKIVNQSNQGVAVARNKGLEIASRKWISFVDSDDIIDYKVYEEAISKLTDNIELMVIGVCEIIGDEIKQRDCIDKRKFYMVGHDEINIIRVGIIDDDSKVISMYKKSNINFTAPWAKFYQKRVIREHKVAFPNGINIGEDKIFNYRYLKCIHNMAIYNSCGYIYRINTMSAMQNYKVDRRKELLETVKCYSIEIEDMDQVLYQFGIRQYLYALKLDICNLKNAKSYKQRKSEAMELRNQELIDMCFTYGKIYKLRLAAIPLAFFAKKSWFGVCDLMLKLKQYMNIRL